MYMASIWDLNVSTVNSYNPLILDLQGTYIGLTRDIYWTYKGHIWDLQGTYIGLTIDIYVTPIYPL